MSMSRPVLMSISMCVPKSISVAESESMSISSSCVNLVVMLSSTDNFQDSDTDVVIDMYSDTDMVSDMDTDIDANTG